MITRHFLKPARVTAVQVTTDPQRTIRNRIDIETLADGRANPGSQRSDSFVVELPTGSALAGPGDWIVRHEDGTLSVATHEQFAATYDSAARAPTHEAIAQRAEELAMERKATDVPGTPEGDWSEAEAQLTREQA